MVRIPLLLLFALLPWRGLCGQASESEAELLERWLPVLQEQKVASPDSATTQARRLLEFAVETEYWQLAGEMQAVLADVQLMTGSMAEAQANYSKALSFLRKLPERSGWTQEEVGIAVVQANILLSQDKYIEANEAYLRILELSDSLNLLDVQAHATNNLGVLYMRLEEDTLATQYFNDAQALFDTLGMRYTSLVCTYNLASIAERQGEEERALKGYSFVASEMAALNEWGDYLSSNTAISRIHRQAGRLDAAALYMNIALDVMASGLIQSSAPVVLYTTEALYNQAALALASGDDDLAWMAAEECLLAAQANNLLDYVSQSSLLLSQIAEKRERFEEAHKYLGTHLHALEELKRDASIREITQLQMSHRFASQIQREKLEQIQKEAERERRNALLTRALLIAVLIALGLAMLYLIQRNKSAKSNLRRAELELEKIELNNHLAYKSKELTTAMVYLLEKNQFITSVAHKLADSKHEFSKKNQSTIQRTINELMQNASKKAWEEFEVHFKDVHAEFYKALRASYPDLTVNEKRLCAFLRLNLNTKEIAAITHQSVKSINMARFRMRKKMRLDSDTDLNAFLASI